MLEDLDLNSIADERARELVRRLLNVLEAVIADLRAAQAENQRLRDEINRLKGEQGTPTIKANTPQQPNKDYSSEQERRTPKAWAKGRKTDRIPIDPAQVVAVNPAHLPPNAVCKGYEDVVVQDVSFRTDNVLFHKEKGTIYDHKGGGNVGLDHGVGHPSCLFAMPKRPSLRYIWHSGTLVGILSGRKWPMR
jgi:hypothetical protein